MLLNLKAFSSLLLALGLFACNGDDDDKATGDYKLVVSKPSSAAVGTAMSIDVALHKGDAIVKDDDAKAAKDGKVNGSVKCKEGDKVEASEVKFNDAGKATLEITIADNSDKTAAAAGTKGYTDCVVSASAEFGKDKTKASGDSGKFTVAAKTDATTTPPAGTLAINVDAKGVVSTSNANDTHEILLKKAAGAGTNDDCEAHLVKWTTDSGTHTVVVKDTSDSDGFDAKDVADVYLSGDAEHCEVSIGAVKANLSTYSETNVFSLTTSLAGKLVLDYDGELAFDWYVMKSDGTGTATEGSVSTAVNDQNDNAQLDVAGVQATDTDVQWDVWIKHGGTVEMAESP